MAIGIPNQPDEQLFDNQKSAVDGLLAQIGQNIKTIRANRWIMALVCSAVLPFMAPEVNAKSSASIDTDNLVKNFSAEIKSEALDFKTILQMPWEKLKAKLEAMSIPQIKEIASQFVAVAGDAKNMPDVGDRLKANIVLGESEKTIFMQMAEKYDISNLTTLKTILYKKQLTPSDSDYLLARFKEILRRQLSVANVYTKIGVVLSQRVAKSKFFASSQDSYEWQSANSSNIQAIEELIPVLQEYIESLEK
jgi:hypothetical protein